jgi:hypothetical protein
LKIKELRDVETKEREFLDGKCSKIGRDNSVV